MIIKIFKKIAKILGIIILTLTLLISSTIVITTFIIGPKIGKLFDEAAQAINTSSYEDFLTNETTYIFDDNGKILKKLTLDQDSEYLLYNDIPRDVINAFIAVEDRNFWNHNGIDIKGIARVLYRYASTSGDEKHGASTITQQITRRTFLNFDVTMDRKIKEIIYSLELEKKYTKEDIIEFYVNDIYYANQCYGISAASKYYFNKPVNELTLSQIAYLCAIPNAPTYYDPLVDASRAVTRRDKILNDMLECNYITKSQYDEAIKEEISLDLSGNIVEFSNYETTYAIKCAVEYFMKKNNFNFRYEYDDATDYENYVKEYNKAYEEAYTQLSKGGYKIHTSLNAEKQEILQTAIDEQLKSNKTLTEDNIYKLQSAATLIDNQTRKVVAIVGGRTQDNLETSEMTDTKEDTENEEDKDVSQQTNNVYSLNRAFQSYRQPGSSIKPLVVYTPGLENGFTPDSTIYSISVSAVNKKGTNIEKLSGAAYSYRHAVEKSDNGCAMYVYYRVGARNGIAHIQKMGFNKILPDDYYMASGLGGLTYGVTTEEMAGAYSALANKGLHMTPTCITSIIDSNGNEIYKEPNPVQAYKQDAAAKMVDIMKGVITHGTAASSVKWSYDIDVAGKTGTTNDNKDGWFCGVSPYYSLAVWVGCDMPETVKGLQGGSYPTKIWSQAMNELHKDLDARSFTAVSSRSLDIEEDSYNLYLPGREDDEVLSDGYTVGDYRMDRQIGTQVYVYISELQAITVKSQEDIAYGNTLYQNAVNTIEEVYSRSYTTELNNSLQNAYSKFKNQVSVFYVAHPELAPQEQPTEEVTEEPVIEVVPEITVEVPQE